MDNLFIGALVRASLCRKHGGTARQHYWNSGGYSRTFKPKARRFSSQVLVSLEEESYSGSNPDRETLISLVDEYPDYSASLEPPELIPSPGLAELQRPSVKNEPASPRIVRSARNEVERKAIEDLQNYLRNVSVSHETLFEKYQALPCPRPLFLKSNSIRKLLNRLSVLERKNVASMLRYLTVIEEIKAAGIRMTVSEWSTAIAFAGRCFSKVTATEVESALHLWKEMELDAKIKSSAATFNILFDIATKSGKFVLAEMILKEMKARGLAATRFTRVGEIYCCGLRGDGDGVRRTYKNLVDAGEIVDTTVLNCVIASLIRAGEPTAARHVFERMKQLSFSRKGLNPPPHQWREMRELGRTLHDAMKTRLSNPEFYQKAKRETSMAPDLRTFRILISHHTQQTGDIEQVIGLLGEMGQFEIPIHGSLFLTILKGFAMHGGQRYGSWTRDRLEGVWKAILQGLDEGVEDLYLGRWIAIYAIRAYGKCCGTNRTLEIWHEIQGRWQPKDGDEEWLKKRVSDVLEGRLSSLKD
ncbi:MAG: hypothetical protein M1829_003772 [Trizodia sp. TS-e1964]|nr:MAG: hypothetical protein M1829_003772 [Trizodia sp. TS-e1964]